MKTTIYLSSENLQIVSGDFSKKAIKIQNAKSYPLPVEAIINGVVTKEAEVVELLKRIRNSKVFNLKSVALVIDSSLVLTKNLEVPILPSKQLYSIAKNELTELEANYEQLVYDYSVINAHKKADGTGTILCCGVERSLLAKYVELFKKANITLKTIDIAINSTIKIFQNTPEFKRKTFILTTVDGNNCLSMLFVDGAFVFSNRARLLAEPGTRELLDEVTGKISALVQFNKSQKTAFEIENAYLCGINTLNSYDYSRMTELTGVQVGRLPNFSNIIYKDDLDMASYLYNIGGLVEMRGV